jgi:hypothetical protein
VGDWRRVKGEQSFIVILLERYNQKQARRRVDLLRR